MPWKVIIDGAGMLLDDLSMDDFVEASAGSDVNWLSLYRSPAADPNAFFKLLGVVARKLEKPTPDKPKTIKDAVAMVTDHVEYVEDDDLPTAFDEGGIPLEGTAVDPETTTSSTSTALESGPQT